MLPLILVATLAHAGVGDPIDGHPSRSERDVHLWTNAARAAPVAFAKDNARGGCDPDHFEQRDPVQPVRWHHGLGVVARQHSIDMSRVGELSHDSSDGTTMVERIQGAYGTGKAFAENVGRGYVDGRTEVLEGWMCSDGHRHNLLDPRWDEAGLGEHQDWWTQDLGDGGGVPHPINVAYHEPAEPRGGVSLWADTWSEHGDAPDSVEAIVDGEVVAMDLAWGTVAQGIWVADTEGDGRCTPYYVEARWGEEVVRWPEHGSYAWGRCDFDDPDAGWLDLQLERGEGPYDAEPWEDTDSPDGPGDEGDPEDDPGLVPWSNLCSSLGGGAIALPLVVLAMGATRRRRRGDQAPSSSRSTRALKRS
jgi:uncharacterized protein (TIGR03382 family)